MEGCNDYTLIDIAPGSPELCFNGIDGSTGHYLLPTLSPREVAKIASNEPLDPAQTEELRRRWRDVKEPHFAPVAGVDAQDLSQAGWGVIFAPDVSEAEKEGLSSLLKLRKEQAGYQYQEFSEERAYRHGDTKYSFPWTIRRGSRACRSEKSSLLSTTRWQPRFYTLCFSIPA